jgi:bifunctional ADP-heptose synthase (sugar kinase/adenylyltransferase)
MSVPFGYNDSRTITDDGPYAYANITTATTTTVKTGAGKLAALIINATAAAAITIYDNTAASGTKIATLKASVAEGSYLYNCQFATGLTIVTAGTPDITVIYR